MLGTGRHKDANSLGTVRHCMKVYFPTCFKLQSPPHTHTYTYTHIHTHTYTHIRTHTHTHTHTEEITGQQREFTVKLV